MLYSILLSLTLLAGVSLSAPDEVTPLKKYAGTVADSRLALIAGPSGMIVDQETLVTIWKAWSIEKPAPSINFRDHLVLVATVSGPNRAFNGPLRLDESGELNYQVASTKIAGPGFGFLMLVVPRAGIQSVNGNPVPGPDATTPPAEDATPDAILVEVVGQITTGIMAVGGETTGTTIQSRGVTWELDFQSADQVELARQLESTKARVRGSLLRIEGIEVKERLIVEVRSIEAANRPVPSESLTASNELPDPVVSNPTGQPVMREPESTIADSGPPANPDLGPLDAFQQITVTTTGPLVAGEQIQTIEPSGDVNFQSGSQTEQWNIPADRLVMLHDHIRRTDWSKVPRLNRSNQPNVFNYTLEIRTTAGITRIFADSPSVADQPAIKMLFRLLRK